MDIAVTPVQFRELPRSSSITALEKQGVGILYNPALPDFLRANLLAVDYVSVIPDMFWVDRGAQHTPRFEYLESWVDFLDWLAQRIPVVAHHIGLSLGSAGLLDSAYVEQMAAWCERYPFLWESDHLSFVQVSGPFGHDHNAGLALPVPYDFEVLELLTRRIQKVQQAISAPFLIENNVYYVDIPDQEMSEPAFLNRLTAQTGCGLLLDIHNIYVNARNHGFDASDFIRQINLDAVVEVHVAGGNEVAGTYTDSHAGPCPDPVWQLLEQVVPRAPNLCGITFEFHESYYPLLKTDGILAQLDKARTIWKQSH